MIGPYYSAVIRTESRAFFDLDKPVRYFVAPPFCMRAPDAQTDVPSSLTIQGPGHHDPADVLSSVTIRGCHVRCREEWDGFVTISVRGTELLQGPWSATKHELALPYRFRGPIVPADVVVVLTAKRRDQHGCIVDVALGMEWGFNEERLP